MTDEGHQVRLLLLRHGRVPHHRGDVPLTEIGVAQSDAAGRWFATERIEVAALFSGETVRTRDTATHFAAGYREVAVGLSMPEPAVSFALRNPDLYIGGHRINMAEGAEAIAAQAPEVEPADVEQSVFFSGLMTAADRVGYWLEHGNVPGDDAHAVGRRIDTFARSLVDVPQWRGRTIVAVTHSPVLRAVRLHHWGAYSREPAFLDGYALTVTTDGAIEFSVFETDTGDVPTTARPGEGMEKL